MFQNTSYWSIYKFSHPTKASEIESIVDLPLNDYSKTDIQELVGSITRLSYRYECPIKQLRESIFYSMNPGVEWNPAILELVRDAKMSVEVPKEADEFGIKKENTSQYLMCLWIDERIKIIKQNAERDLRLEEHFKELAGKTSEQILDEYDRTHTPIAPDLSKGDNLENRIIAIASNLVNYLEYYFRPLSNAGRWEAMIYCCNLLVKFRPDHGNDIFLSKLSDRVFLLLADQIAFQIERDYNRFYDLFNQRTSKWSKNRYPVASLYKAFYMTPFEDLDAYKNTDDVEPAILSRFGRVLSSMKVRLVGVFGDLGLDHDFLMMPRHDYLKQCGITQFGIDNLIGTPEPEPKPLVINPDFSMYVKYENFKCRIFLSPIEKAVYLLYLNHPEGIAFKDLGDYRSELADLYKKISRRNNEEEIEKTISRIVDPFNNSVNEKCARIKKAFEDTVPQELVHWYVISGEKGGIRKVVLQRECVIRPR